MGSAGGWSSREGRVHLRYPPPTGPLAAGHVRVHCATHPRQQTGDGQSRERARLKSPVKFKVPGVLRRARSPLWRGQFACPLGCGDDTRGVKALGTRARCHTCALRKAFPGAPGQVRRRLEPLWGTVCIDPRRTVIARPWSLQAEQERPALVSGTRRPTREGRERGESAAGAGGPKGSRDDVRGVSPRPGGHSEAFSSRTSARPGPSPLPHFVFVIWGPRSEKASALCKRRAPQNPPPWLSGDSPLPPPGGLR